MAKPRKMKAVSLIVEYVILFMFGIMIFISCVSVFSNYEKHFRSISMDDQLSEVRQYVESGIIKLAEKEKEDSSVALSIPKKAGNEYYRIELSSQGLNVTSLDTKVTKHSSVCNLAQNIELKGRVISSAGSMIIYKTGNQIIIS